MIEVAAAAGGRLSSPAAHRLAAIGGNLEWALRPAKRRVLAENLGHAIGRQPGDPALRRLVRREVVNEAHRSADLLWSISRPEELMQRVRFEGLEPLRAALRRGRGVIVAGPHIGGWEVVGPVPASVAGGPVAVVVSEDLLAGAIDRFRRRNRLEPVSIRAHPRVLIGHLRRGGMLLVFSDILPDRGMRTVAVRLLDAVAELPSGAAALARMTGAPIFPLAVLPLDHRAWLIELGAEIPAPPRSSGASGEHATMQALADAWTAVIRRVPEQWAAVYPLDWR